MSKLADESTKRISIITAGLQRSLKRHPMPTLAEVLAALLQLFPDEVRHGVLVLLFIAQGLIPLSLCEPLAAGSGYRRLSDTLALAGAEFAERRFKASYVKTCRILLSLSRVFTEMAAAQLGERPSGAAGPRPLSPGVMAARFTGAVYRARVWADKAIASTPELDKLENALKRCAGLRGEIRACLDTLGSPAAPTEAVLTAAALVDRAAAEPARVLLPEAAVKDMVDTQKRIRDWLAPTINSHATTIEVQIGGDNRLLRDELRAFRLMTSGNVASSVRHFFKSTTGRFSRELFGKVLEVSFVAQQASGLPEKPSRIPGLVAGGLKTVKPERVEGRQRRVRFGTNTVWITPPPRARRARGVGNGGSNRVARRPAACPGEDAFGNLEVAALAAAISRQAGGGLRRRRGSREGGGDLPSPGLGSVSAAPFGGAERGGSPPLPAWKRVKFTIEPSPSDLP